VTEHSKELPITDLPALFGRRMTFEARTAESPVERGSRLKREEAEVEHSLRSEAEEAAHTRRLSLLVHVFVMVIVAVAFSASVYIAVAKDPKTGLPDKAMGIITAIVAASVGYMTGKGSK